MLLIFCLPLFYLPQNIGVNIKIDGEISLGPNWNYIYKLDEKSLERLIPNTRAVFRGNPKSVEDKRSNDTIKSEKHKNINSTKTSPGHIIKANKSNNSKLVKFKDKPTPSKSKKPDGNNTFEAENAKYLSLDSIEIKSNIISTEEHGHTTDMKRNSVEVDLNDLETKTTKSTKDLTADCHQVNKVSSTVTHEGGKDSAEGNGAPNLRANSDLSSIERLKSSTTERLQYNVVHIAFNYGPDSTTPNSEKYSFVENLNLARSRHNSSNHNEISFTTRSTINKTKNSDSLGSSSSSENESGSSIITSSRDATGHLNSMSDDIEKQSDSEVTTEDYKDPILKAMSLEMADEEINDRMTKSPPYYSPEIDGNNQGLNIPYPSHEMPVYIPSEEVDQESKTYDTAKKKHGKKHKHIVGFSKSSEKTILSEERKLKSSLNILLKTIKPIGHRGSRKKKFPDENKEGKPHRVKDDVRVKKFTEHVLRQGVQMLEKIKDRLDNINAHRKIDYMVRSYIEKFQDFVNDTKYQNVLTKLGTQKVVLNTIDTSNQILKRLISFLMGDINSNKGLRSDKRIEKSLEHEINKEIELEYKHACKRLGICRSVQGYTAFVADVLKELLAADDSKMLQCVDALTESLKHVDLSQFADRELVKHYKTSVAKIEKLDVLRLRPSIAAFRNMLITRNKPLTVKANSKKRVVNRTIAMLEFFDVLDEKIEPNEENKQTWQDIKTSIHEWKGGKRQDIADIMRDLIKHTVHKGIRKLNFNEAANVLHIMKIVFDHTKH